MRELQGKEGKPAPSLKKERKKALFGDANKYLRRSGKSEKDRQAEYLDKIAIENSLLLSGSGGGQLYHEQYDEHGVKIEHQCFN